MVSDTKSSIQEHLLKKYNKTLLNKREYANEAGLSISTIDNYIQKGEGIANYIKLGKSKNAKVMFNIVDIADFFAKGGSNESNYR